MIQTLPKRSRQGQKIISQVRATYDRQCSECDDVIERGEDCLLVHDTDSRGIPVSSSSRVMHCRHWNGVQLVEADGRQLVGEF
jgi:hypothetical protein